MPQHVCRLRPSCGRRLLPMVRLRTLLLAGGETCPTNRQFCEHSSDNSVNSTGRRQLLPQARVSSCITHDIKRDVSVNVWLALTGMVILILWNHGANIGQRGSYMQMLFTQADSTLARRQPMHEPDKK